MYDGSMTELAITNKLGIVHAKRSFPYTMCRKMTAAERVVPVTPLQARVFRLPPCDEPECFKSLDAYHKLIGRAYHER